MSWYCGICERHRSSRSYTGGLNDDVKLCHPCNQLVNNMSKSYYCSKCNKLTVDYTVSYVHLIEYGEKIDVNMCHDCNFWKDVLLEDKPNDEGVRVFMSTDYGCYQARHGDNLDNRLRGSVGHGGREFKLLRCDGVYAHSRNVWHQGTVPEVWRKDFAHLRAMVVSM